jgi:ribulose-phosphate 3-epimerase
MRQETGARFLIEVDGGVDERNAPLLIEAGVDVLVAGNTVFSAEDPEEMIRRLKRDA